MAKKRKFKTPEERVVEVVRSIRPAATRNGDYEAIRIVKAAAILLNLPSFEYRR